MESTLGNITLIKPKLTTKNLRNSLGVANLLSELRDAILFVQHAASLKKPCATLSPRQEIGHFIHGTIPRIYVLPLETMTNPGDVFNMVLSTEINRLQDLGAQNFKVVNHGIDFTNADSGSMFIHERKVFSLEWPAVIVTIKTHYRDHFYAVTYGSFLAMIYLAISRARVSCSVILVLDRSPFLVTERVFLKDYIEDFLKSIENYALVKKY